MRQLAACGTVLAGSGVASVGVGLVPHLLEGGSRSLGFLAVCALGVGVALVIGGTMALTRRRRRGARALAVAGAVLVTVLSLMVVAPSVAATNVPRTELGATPSSRGLPEIDVEVVTDDGATLAGWYVPSQTGAAVVLRHGAGSTRSSVLPQAEVLARHGYGVLLLDARGHGRSDGRAMDFGWYGEDDIRAAVRFLVSRDDVDAERIGLVGSSMGGEEAIGAAGVVPGIRAVVAEGATARVAADKAWLSDHYGVRGFVQEQIERVQFALTDVLTAAPSPRPLRDAVAASGRTSFLLISAGQVTDEHHAAEYIATGAPTRVQLWTVPDAPHTGGLRTYPEEWEQRVTAFLEANLLA